MNDIIFHTHTLPSPFWLMNIPVLIIIGLLNLALIFKDELGFVKEKDSRRKIIISLGVIAGVSVATLITLILMVVAYSKPVIYSTESIFTDKSVSLDDFNKTMKNDYNYEFTKIIKNEGSGKQISYNITDLKTNKQYKNCTLDFEKSGHNKVKLNEVNCAKNVIQDILKNKTAK